MHISLFGWPQNSVNCDSLITPIPVWRGGGFLWFYMAVNDANKTASRCHLICHLWRAVACSMCFVAKCLLAIQHDLPRMQPGNLSFSALSMSEGLIQFPSCPLTPSWGTGIVSRLLGDEMTVLLSTRATSAGSVLASQLKYIWRTKQVAAWALLTTVGAGDSSGEVLWQQLNLYLWVVYFWPNKCLPLDCLLLTQQISTSGFLQYQKPMGIRQYLWPKCTINC